MRKLLLVVIAVGLVAFWWKSTFESAPSPEVSSTSAPAPAAVVGTSSAVTQSVSDLPASPILSKPAISNAIDEKNRTVIRKCFDQANRREIHLDDRMRLEDLLSSFGSSGAVVDHLVVNLHVRNRDGNVTRLHLGRHDSETTKDRYTVGGYDVRFFGVDSENLPVPQPFPEGLKLKSVSDVLDTFMQSGDVIFKERRSYRRFRNDDAANVVEMDGRLAEMQLFFNGKSLGCAWADAHLACDCL